MVRKLICIGLICLLAAGIASCKFLSGTLDFLTTSYYPFYLSRVLERYDVADLIPELKGLSSEDVRVSFAYLPSSSGKHLLMKVVFQPRLTAKHPKAASSYLTSPCVLRGAISVRSFLSINSRIL
jgi:hypothetical protein